MVETTVPRRLGDIVAVPLADGMYGYGRVLSEPLMAFYKLRTPNILASEEVLNAPVAFVIFVMNYAITDGLWRVIGNSKLESSLLVEPLFFKKDPISNKLSIYRDSTGEEVPASVDECN